MNFRNSCALAVVIVAGLTLFACPPQSAEAGVTFFNDGNLGGGTRWDASPRIINGNERSLDGGLRYSVSGGSYQAFRDLFTWSQVPSVTDFTLAVDQAFAAWTSVDPVSNLGTSISFVADFGTPVVGSPGFGGVADFDGAEIDLLGVDAGNPFPAALTTISVIFDDVTLTSGTPNYGGAQGGAVLRGTDLYLNTNPGVVYSLNSFRRVLTHELGHAIGMTDAEDFSGHGFIDDNYDGTNSATALATLTNSWALLVDPANPAASVGLTHFAPGVVANADPGLDTAGVNILMESGLGSGIPLSELVPLRNDDYGMRQFLYPVVVPEPSTMALAGFGLMMLATWSWRRRNG